MRVRIGSFIDDNISDPTLSPLLIADAIGVSVRHLHRVFSASGNSMGDYIRARRLEQCIRDLADPRLRGRSITEIAFARGFCDAAHFSHSFRKHFGMSARTFRALGMRRNRLPAKYEAQLSRAGMEGGRPN